VVGRFAPSMFTFKMGEIIVKVLTVCTRSSHGYKDKKSEKSDALGGYFFVTETYLSIFYACVRIE
jgi:hypothetical protein